MVSMLSVLLLIRVHKACIMVYPIGDVGYYVVLSAMVEDQGTIEG